MKKHIVGVWAMVAAIGAYTSGCATANRWDVGDKTPDSNLTAGKVQREIHVGMSGAEVAAALGSPNIVTKDADGNETWVYDKIATEASYSTSVAGAAGGGAIVSTLLVGMAGQSSGASRTSQSTLTVIIKFDKTGQVETFSYHQSKF